MRRVVLEYVRKKTGSVIRLEMVEPNTGPFAWVEGFNGFECRRATYYEVKDA